MYCPSCLAVLFVRIGQLQPELSLVVYFVQVSTKSLSQQSSSSWNSSGMRATLSLNLRSLAFSWRSNPKAHSHSHSHALRCHCYLSYLTVALDGQKFILGVHHAVAKESGIACFEFRLMKVILFVEHPNSDRILELRRQVLRSWFVYNFTAVGCHLLFLYCHALAVAETNQLGIDEQFHPLACTKSGSFMPLCLAEELPNAEFLLQQGLPLFVEDLSWQRGRLEHFGLYAWKSWSH